MSCSGDEVEALPHIDAISISEPAEEPQDCSDTEEKHVISPPRREKQKHHNKNQKHSIPPNIESQIGALPEVHKYITKLLNKLQSYDKEIRKLKRKSTKIGNKSKIGLQIHDKRASEDKLKNNSNAKYNIKNSIQKETRASSKHDNEAKFTPPVSNEAIVKESKTATLTNPNPICEWGQEEGISLADQVREAAESVLQESGFVYQESIGLYYDRSTGYYYDQNSGLYYDGINKTYYTYDEESHLFHVYHQIDNSAKDAEEEEIAQWEQGLKKRKKELRVKKKKKKTRKEDSEEEEGQCSESSESEAEDSAKPTRSTNDLGYEKLIPSAEEVAPCMRLMVLETELKNLRVGTLFLVTCTGGTMGREGSGHAVCIPDINVSKHHAKFTFDNGQYLLCDLGSRNGTFLDGSRLSVALQESESKIVQHGSELRVGCTKIRCHIHPGNETCGHCEPGLVQQADPQSDKSNVIVKEAQHRDELLRLRRRFALTGQQEPDVVAIAEKAGYQDRAGHRRQTVGSLHHGAKTEAASLEQAVPESNKGFKLLSKMGWKSGQALGKDGTGSIEPISLQMRVAKSGLGANNVPAPVQITKGSKRKQEVWSKTRDRYQQLPNTTNIFEED